ncbi:MAG: hypothetical protein HC764_14710 [Pleurocapsa sp. CRU_1_2]|nr:hypothetical protein [Pleurocapsa sp. CRU_1_2]
MWSDGEEQENSSTLASLGLGINWELGETFSIQSYYGIPLIDVESQQILYNLMVSISLFK